MMLPVTQRRPRHGKDFVLSDVPMLDSPEWSDEESDVKQNGAAMPSPAGAMVAAAAARAAFQQGILSPQTQQFVAGTGGGSCPNWAVPPQPVNEWRYFGPAQRFASPFQDAALPVQSRFSPTGPRHRHGCRIGINGALVVSGNESATSKNKTAANGHNFCRRIDARGATSSARTEGLAAVVAEPKSVTAQQQQKQRANKSEGLDADAPSPQHHVDSFAVPRIVEYTHFGGGSLFVLRPPEDDDTSDPGDEKLERSSSSSSSSTGSSDSDVNSISDDDSAAVNPSAHAKKRDVATQGSESHKRNRREGESVVAPSYAPSYAPSANHATSTDQQPPPRDPQQRQLRKPSLFVIPSAPNRTPAPSAFRPVTATTSDISAAPSMFQGLLASSGDAEEDEDDEDDEDCTAEANLMDGASRMFAGAQSTWQIPSTTVVKDHDGGLNDTHTTAMDTNHVNAYFSSAGNNAISGISGYGTGDPLHNRHGTFLMATTEDANHSAPAAAPLQPVGAISSYSFVTEDVLTPPSYQTVVASSHPQHTNHRSHSNDAHYTMVTSVQDIMAAAANTQSNNNNMNTIENDYSTRTSSGAPIRAESPSRSPSSHMQLQRQRYFAATSVDYAPEVRDHAKLVHANDQTDSARASEEDMFEQMQQSRFFQSVNSRMALRRGNENEYSRIGNFYAGLTSSDTPLLSSGGGNAAEGVEEADTPRQVEGREAASRTNASAPLSATAHGKDRLNFRDRIATRQPQPAPLYSSSQTKTSSALNGANVRRGGSEPIEGSDQNSNAISAPYAGMSASRRRGAKGGTTSNLGISLDYNVLYSTATTTSNESEGDSNTKRAAAIAAGAPAALKHTSVLSTMTSLAYGGSASGATGFGSTGAGMEGDEYGLLHWSNFTPTSTRLSSAVSSDGRAPPPPPVVTPLSCGGASQNVMPISTHAPLPPPGQPAPTTACASLTTRKSLSAPSPLGTSVVAVQPVPAPTSVLVFKRQSATQKDNTGSPSWGPDGEDPAHFQITGYSPMARRQTGNGPQLPMIGGPPHNEDNAFLSNNVAAGAGAKTDFHTRFTAQRGTADTTASSASAAAAATAAAVVNRTSLNNNNNANNTSGINESGPSRRSFPTPSPPSLLPTTVKEPMKRLSASNAVNASPYREELIALPPLRQRGSLPAANEVNRATPRDLLAKAMSTHSATSFHGLEDYGFVFDRDQSGGNTIAGDDVSLTSVPEAERVSVPHSTPIRRSAPSAGELLDAVLPAGSTPRQEAEALHAYDEQQGKAPLQPRKASVFSPVAGGSHHRSLGRPFRHLHDTSREPSALADVAQSSTSSKTRKVSKSNSNVSRKEHLHGSPVSAASIAARSHTSSVSAATFLKKHGLFFSKHPKPTEPNLNVSSTVMPALESTNDATPSALQPLTSLRAVEHLPQVPRLVPTLPDSSPPSTTRVSSRAATAAKRFSL